MDGGYHVGGGAAFHLRQRGSEAEKVTVVGRNLHAGNDEESFHGGSILTNQASPHKMLHGVAGIVICHGDAAQPAALGGGDHSFGRAAPI